MGDRKSVALLARCAAVRARRAVHETCRLECSSVSSPLRKPEAESRVTPHGRSGPAPPELLGTSRLLRSNPAAQLPPPLIGTVSGSRGITRRLGRSSGKLNLSFSSQVVDLTYFRRLMTQAGASMYWNGVGHFRRHGLVQSQPAWYGRGHVSQCALAAQIRWETAQTSLTASLSGAEVCPGRGSSGCC